MTPTPTPSEQTLSSGPESLSSPHRRLYSAVVDLREPFITQAQRLVWSLTTFLEVSGEDIILHCIGKPTAPLIRMFDTFGVRHSLIDPFPGHKYCNKLQSHQILKTVPWTDVVLLDCDMLILGDLPLPSSSIRAKPVDYPNPPIGVLETIFKNAQVPIKYSSTDIDAHLTVHGNANGGLYIVPREHFSLLSEEWITWALWCVERIDLFQSWNNHVDQVAFALALQSTKLPYDNLERSYNFPLHIPESELDDCSPNVLHYHNIIQDDGSLPELAGLPVLNSTIRRLNNRMPRFK